MRRLLWIAVIALALAAAACGDADRSEEGEIVEGGDVSVFSVQVGDCFQDTTSTEVQSLEAVPCSEPHDNEMYAFYDIPDGDWPGTEAIFEGAVDRCLEEFESYVGAAYEESLLDFSFLTPTEQSWNELDDRTVGCFLYDFDLAKLTGSMKGSGI